MWVSRFCFVLGGRGVTDLFLCVCDFVGSSFYFDSLRVSFSAFGSA